MSWFTWNSVVNSLYNCTCSTRAFSFKKNYVNFFLLILNRKISSWLIKTHFLNETCVMYLKRLWYSQSLVRIQTRTRSQRLCGGTRRRRQTQVLQPSHGRRPASYISRRCSNFKLVWVRTRSSTSFWPSLFLLFEWIQPSIDKIWSHTDVEQGRSTLSSPKKNSIFFTTRDLVWLIGKETDRFFATSGVHLAQHDRGLFHFRHTVSSTTPGEKVVSTLVKDVVLRISTQYWWGVYHFKNTYSPITLANTSRVDFSDLVFSLSSHRH